MLRFTYTSYAQECPQEYAQLSYNPGAEDAMSQPESMHKLAWLHALCMHTCTHMQTNRQTGRQADRQTETDRQTDGRTDGLTL